MTIHQNPKLSKDPYPRKAQPTEKKKKKPKVYQHLLPPKKKTKQGKNEHLHLHLENAKMLKKKKDQKNSP